MPLSPFEALDTELKKFKPKLSVSEILSKLFTLKDHIFINKMTYPLQSL